MKKLHEMFLAWEAEKFLSVLIEKHFMERRNQIQRLNC
jgi:hypothetical protein